MGGAQAFDSHSATFAGLLAGSWTGSKQLGLQLAPKWDAGTVGGDLTHLVTELASTILLKYFPLPYL